MAPRKSKRRAATNTVNTINMPNLSPQTQVNNQPLIVNDQINTNSHNITPIIHVQNFNGNNMQINFFIEQIKDLSETYNWNDKYTLMYTKSKLTGKALELINQAQEINKFTNTEELFKKLKTLFKVQSIATNINDFHNFAILSEENIQNTAHRLDLVAHRVYKDVDNESLNKIKFVKFLQVIPSKFREKILENNISNYQEAVEKAELLQNCDANNKILNGGKEEDNRFSDLTHQVNSLQASIENIEKSKQENSKHGNKANKSKNNHFHNKNRGNIGNVKRNFRNGRYNIRNRRNFRNHRGGSNYKDNGNYRVDNHNQIQCQFCDRWGHSAKYCYNFQNNFPNYTQTQNYPAIDNPIINHPN